MIIALVALILTSTSFGNELTFNHDFHVKQQKISCKRCHGFAEYKKPVELVNKALCHSCHVDKTPELAPLNCKSCHGNVNAKPTQKMPAFHNIPGFKSGAHSLMASKSQQTCMECHKKRDCSECHNRSRSLLSNPHPTFFIRTHGMDAKIGINNCSACHSKNTCTQCHRKSL